MKPDLPKAVCLAIVKFIGMELIYGSLPLDQIKTRRVELQGKHEAWELQAYFYHLHAADDEPPNGVRPDQQFLETYETDLAAAAAAAIPPELDATAEVAAELPEA